MAHGEEQMRVGRLIITLAALLAACGLVLVWVASKGLVSWPAPALLFGLAGLASVAAVYMRLLERERKTRLQLEAQEARLAAVHKVADALSEAVELPELLGQGLERAVRALGLDGGQIHLISEGREKVLHLSQIFGPDSHHWLQENTIRVGECICGQVAQDGEPVVVDDAGSDPRIVGRACAAGGTPSIASVPLRTRGGTVGVLTVRSCNPHHFLLQDVALLTSVANFLAAAIENARIRAEMQGRITELTAKVRKLAILQERERISREMHDGLAQTLGLLNVQIEMAKGAVAAGRWQDASDELAQLDHSISAANLEVREALTNLRNTTPRGEEFVAGLQNVLADFQVKYQVRTRLVANNGGSAVCFPPLVELEIQRVIQEALTNVRRHARANHLEVHVEQADDSWQVTVADDGLGFDVDRLQANGGHRYGLITMRERIEGLGGDLAIESRPGQGTRVRIQVPRPALESCADERGVEWTA